MAYSGVWPKPSFFSGHSLLEPGLLQFANNNDHKSKEYQEVPKWVTQSQQEILLLMSWNSNSPLLADQGQLSMARWRLIFARWALDTRNPKYIRANSSLEFIVILVPLAKRTSNVAYPRGVDQVPLLSVSPWGWWYGEPPPIPLFFLDLCILPTGDTNYIKGLWFNVCTETRRLASYSHSVLSLSWCMSYAFSTQFQHYQATNLQGLSRKSPAIVNTITVCVTSM